MPCSSSGPRASRSVGSRCARKSAPPVTWAVAPFKEKASRSPDRVRPRAPPPRKPEASSAKSLGVLPLHRRAPGPGRSASPGEAGGRSAGARRGGRPARRPTPGAAPPPWRRAPGAAQSTRLQDGEADHASGERTERWFFEIYHSDAPGCEHPPRRLRGLHPHCNRPWARAVHPWVARGGCRRGRVTGKSGQKRENHRQRGENRAMGVPAHCLSLGLCLLSTTVLAEPDIFGPRQRTARGPAGAADGHHHQHRHPAHRPPPPAARRSAWAARRASPPGSSSWSSRSSPRAPRRPRAPARRSSWTPRARAAGSSRGWSPWTHRPATSPRRSPPPSPPRAPRWSACPSTPARTCSLRGSLLAPPWDGRSGGVLAFLATDAVLNQGLISADGAGFRGGVFSASHPRSPGARSRTSPRPRGARTRARASSAPRPARPRMAMARWPMARAEATAGMQAEAAVAMEAWAERAGSPRPRMARATWGAAEARRCATSRCPG